jgi:hypothetical protein
MFIKIPVILSQETELEDVQGEPVESIARINPEHIAYYHYFNDNQTLIGVSGMGEFVANMSCDDIDFLMDTHEITIYEN